MQVWAVAIALTAHDDAPCKTVTIDRNKARILVLSFCKSNCVLGGLKIFPGTDLTPTLPARSS